MTQGANGAITVTPNGTGSTVLVGPSISSIIAPAANIAALQVRNSVTFSDSETYPSLLIVKTRSNALLADMTNEPAVMNFTVRDSTNTNRNFGRWIGRYAGPSANPTFTLRGSPDGFTSNLHYMTLGGGVGTFGSTSSNYTLTSNTGGNLVLTANANTDSGTITVASGANGNISLAPNGTGKVVISGLSYPTADGTANQVLKTDGSGNLSFVDQTAGVTTFVGLSDTPANFTSSAGYYVKVNSGATALEFSQDIDDGTF
jgi:hypothetical protein